MDHTGGMRTYVAEGATVIFHPGQGLLRKGCQVAAHSRPDDLQKNRDSGVH